MDHWPDRESFSLVRVTVITDGCGPLPEARAAPAPLTAIDVHRENGGLGTVNKKSRNCVALTGLVVACVVTGTGQAASAAPEAASVPSPAAAQAMPAAPGTLPAIQRWFLDIDKARIDFNNVLQRAERDIAAGNGTANCSALGRATDRIKVMLPRLSAVAGGGAAIAAAYGPPIDQFAAVAAACSSGNFAMARTLLGNTTSGAIAAYGAAQETVDELLDGGA